MLPSNAHQIKHPMTYAPAHWQLFQHNYDITTTNHAARRVEALWGRQWVIQACSWERQTDWSPCDRRDLESIAFDLVWSSDLLATLTPRSWTLSARTLSPPECPAITTKKSKLGVNDRSGDLTGWLFTDWDMDSKLDVYVSGRIKLISGQKKSEIFNKNEVKIMNRMNCIKWAGVYFSELLFESNEQKFTVRRVES